MELDTLGDRKTALFVIISDTDDTFNFVVSILYTQLFNLLCDKADDVYGGRLPVHVRCLLDEFANIGQIPKFEKLIATIRSREISASIILQSQSQLKAIYKDNADTIVGNCDTTLFLGGKEKSTLKEISEILGKETIDSFNTSETRGRELSHGLNYQKLGKDMQQQYEEIKRQCNQERTRLDTEARDREAQISTMAESTSKTIRELTSQKDRLLQEVEQLKSQKDGLETVIELDHERERLEIINDSLRDTERKLREKGDEAVTVLQKKLQQATTNAVDTAFEGRIADQIFQAAAGWNKNNQDEILKRIASQLVDTQRTDVLYDGLRLLDAEGERSRYPYIVLLDEANLSPIEYYWADFMNVCDSDSRFSKITLGNDIQLKIPPTLRFVATINNDDTTERLSPRLIDRATLIRLPDVPYKKIEDEDLTDTSFVNPVEWSALQAVFAPDTSLELDAMPSEIYKDICILFRENMKLSVSPRVDHAIRRYWTAAKNLFESESGNDTTIIALDYAVAQKLIPKINGNGKAYSEFLSKFQELCEKSNLEKSRRLLTSIIKRGETSMGYYQYF